MAAHTQQKHTPTLIEQLNVLYRQLKADKAKERDYFIENLSMLVASGMPLLSAIQTLREEIVSPSLQKSLDDLEADIEAGSTLWKALDDTKLFQPHTISLVRIGEESGKLSANLKLIAIQEEKDKALRGKIIGAVLYPLLVLSLTAGVGIAIAWFILPRLATVFNQLNVELPTLTRYLINSGQFLEVYGIFVFPTLIAAVIIAFYFIFFYPGTKYVGQFLLFATPGVGRLLREVEISRFGYLFGTLLEAGLPATQSLDSLCIATDAPPYKKLYGHLRDSVEEGNSIQRSFASYPRAHSLVPISIVRLIGAGEQSGNLSEVLIRISSTYEQKTENTAKNLTVLLEPILLVVVWGGVVLVALAVIMPIYSLIGNFNSGTKSPQSQQSSQVSAPAEVPVTTHAATTTEIQNEQLLDERSQFLETPSGKAILGSLTVLSTDLGYLNVRSGPASSFEKINEVYPGETFSYTGVEEGWYEIFIDEEVYGWVSSTYVEITPDEATTE